MVFPGIVQHFLHPFFCVVIIAGIDDGQVLAGRQSIIAVINWLRRIKENIFCPQLAGIRIAVFDIQSVAVTGADGLYLIRMRPHILSDRIVYVLIRQVFVAYHNAEAGRQILQTNLAHKLPVFHRRLNGSNPGLDAVFSLEKMLNLIFGFLQLFFQ